MRVPFDDFEEPEPAPTPDPTGGPETPAPETGGPTSGTPDAPTTPPDPGHATPGGAPPPGEPPAGTPDPAAAPPGPGSGKPAVGRRSGVTVPAARTAWRHWWEYNRDGLVGVRHLAYRNLTVTGGIAATGTLDPLRDNRPQVMASLRRVAAAAAQPDRVRRAALVALGRIGDPDDALLLLTVLRDRHESTPVREASALALGLLESSPRASTREAVRKHLGDVVADPRLLPTVARQLAVMSAGRHARTDKQLIVPLARQAIAGVRTSDDAAALAFAIGLAGDPILAPELTRGAKRASFASKDLNDVPRAHAALAIGRLADPSAARTMLTLLKARSVRAETRRGAAVALGRLLREGQVAKDDHKEVVAALVKLQRRKGDPVLRGLAALALAGAPRPTGMHAAMDEIDGGADQDAKPFFALALGVAARKAQPAMTRRIRAYLAKKLARANEPELTSALAVALGLATATDALPGLLDILEDSARPAAVRGAAANGAGMLGRGSARAEKALIDAMRKGPPDLIAEAAIGLGMSGRRSAVNVLIEMLHETGSVRARGRTIRALGFLGHHNAVGPLLKILDNRRLAAMVRMDAAIALGLIGNTRAVDPLFDLARDLNHYGTTKATFEYLYWA